MAPEHQAVFDKTSFKNWLGQHPGIRSIKYQLYVLCALLLSRTLWKKSFNESTADYIYGALLLYGLFLFFQIYRKKKSLKREYEAGLDASRLSGDTGDVSAHAVPHGVTPPSSAVSKAVKYAVAVLVVGVIAVFLFGRGGEGMDATLDASNGFDVNYHASLAKANEKMSDGQKETYNWVVSEISAANFMSRYGKSPTVREVIKGQLDLWEKHNKQRLAEQEALVATKAEDIAARTALQERARKMLGTIYATAEITTRPGKKTCEGVVCDSGEQTLIVYKVYNPSNLNLVKMPCNVTVTPRNADTAYTYELGGCVGQGAFETSINVPKGVSFDGATLAIHFTDEEAMVGYGDPAIPGDIPEVVKLKELQQNTKDIAAGRASLKG